MNMPNTPFLALDIAGNPFAWLSCEHAAHYYATDKVAWDLGDEALVLHGGYNCAGQRSELAIKPIFAVLGSEIMARMARHEVSLPERDNGPLFRRDRMTCIYCGQRYPRSLLTRDHIVPRSRGGRNVWTNCATACMDCNQAKADKPVEAFRPLLYVPYTPCRFENFLLTGRNIIADQHEYLAARLPAYSRHCTS